MHEERTGLRQERAKSLHWEEKDEKEGNSIEDGRGGPDLRATLCAQRRLLGSARGGAGCPCGWVPCRSLPLQAAPSRPSPPPVPLVPALHDGEEVAAGDAGAGPHVQKVWQHSTAQHGTAQHSMGAHGRALAHLPRLATRATSWVGVYSCSHRKRRREEKRGASPILEMVRVPSCTPAHTGRAVT